MAMFAGQVSAQDGCPSNAPACELSFSPSTDLLLGESFNVTCTILSGECEPGSECYNFVFTYFSNSGRFVDHEFGTFARFITKLPIDPSDGCSQTLSINSEVDQLKNDYIHLINNAQWSVQTQLSSNDGRRAQSITHTTKVQVLRSGTPQESIIVQPLDILTNITGLASNQFIGGNYQIRTMLEWPHADSLQNSNGTYYGREYQINGTMQDGSEGELISTIANSTELNLNSRQIPQSLTLITKNEVGIAADTVSFQISWSGPSIDLRQQDDDRWRMVVDFTEAVANLTVADSRMESIVLSDVDIAHITNNNLVNSALTFTAT